VNQKRYALRSSTVGNYISVISGPLVESTLSAKVTPSRPRENEPCLRYATHAARAVATSCAPASLRWKLRWPRRRRRSPLATRLSLVLAELRTDSAARTALEAERAARDEVARARAERVQREEAARVKAEANARANDDDYASASAAFWGVLGPQQASVRAPPGASKRVFRNGHWVDVVDPATSSNEGSGSGKWSASGSRGGSGSANRHKVCLGTGTEMGSGRTVPGSNPGVLSTRMDLASGSDGSSRTSV
jgi:hypothetical protein